MKIINDNDDEVDDKSEKKSRFSEKRQITDSSQSFLNNLTIHASHFVQDAFNVWDAKSRLLRRT